MTGAARLEAGSGLRSPRAWPFSATVLALAVSSACGSSAPVDDAMRATDAGRFVVTLRSAVEPVPVGRIHSWTLRVATPDGRPVDGAILELDGGMPAHAHGLPTVPEIAPAGTPGDYIVQGMKFSMTGHWTLTVTAYAEGVRDAVTYDLVLP